MYKMADLLRAMMVKNSSDLFITANATPSFKVDGKIYPIAGNPLSGRESQELCYSIMNEEQRRVFESTKECNFAIHPKQIGRFGLMYLSSKAPWVWFCERSRPKFRLAKNCKYQRFCKR